MFFVLSISKAGMCTWCISNTTPTYLELGVYFVVVFRQPEQGRVDGGDEVEVDVRFFTRLHRPLQTDKNKQVGIDVHKICMCVYMSTSSLAFITHCKQTKTNKLQLMYTKSVRVFICPLLH